MARARSRKAAPRTAAKKARRAAHTDSTSGASNPELEAAIDAAFDAAWQDGHQGRPAPGAIEVYADWLQERGHPLGDQLALELSPEDRWKKEADREAAIAAGREAHAELHGAGLPIGDEYRSPVRVDWTMGFITSLSLNTENKKVLASCLEGLRALPTARFVRAIHVRNAAAVDLAQLVAFPSLRELAISKGAPDLSAFAGGHLRSLTLPLLDERAARHVEALPELDTLRVADWTLARPLAARALRRLSIGDGHHHARKLRSLEPLAKLAALESLAIEGGALGSLAPLAKLKSLKYLTVASAKSLTSLAGLEKLAALEELDVNLTAVASVEPLRRCRKLRSVNLRGTKVKDLSPLWGLAELEAIFAEKTKIKSIEGIGALGKLQRLWIFDTAVRDLAPLAPLHALELLNLAGLKNVEHADVLARLPKLRSLDVMAMRPPFDPEVVAQAPALEDVRGCDWPPASRMVGVPLVLDAAAMKRSGLPANVRFVSLPRAAMALAVSDDGRRVAVALGSARHGDAPTVQVFATEDGSLVHAYTHAELPACRGLCMLADDTLLMIAGEGYYDLWRAEIGEPPVKIGRTDAWHIFRDGPGKTVALVQDNKRSIAFAPAKAPLAATWTYAWGDHVPHVHWGVQVRFVGDTARALVSGVHDPVLVDVKKQKVLRTFTHAGVEDAFADATRDGRHVVVWHALELAEPPWFWVYAGDSTEPLSFDDEDFVVRSTNVVFTPDGAHLMKHGDDLELAALATGTSVGEALATPARPGASFSPGMHARKAPLVAWTSFNYRDDDFRIYWAAFSAG